METKDIIILNELVFPCPLNWTVEEAENRIRTEYVIRGGIRNNGVPVLGTARIRDLTDPLTFVGAQLIQQLGAAATSASADPFTRFIRLLGPSYTVDAETAIILKFRLSTKLLTISTTKDAIALLDMALAYPHRSTAHRFEEGHNLIVNGPFQVDSTPAYLVRAYSSVDGSPQILKFYDAENEYRIYEKFQLTKELAKEKHLVHYEGLIVDEGGKKAVVMQAYINALEQVPFYPEHIVLRGVQSIMLGLKHLHSKDIVHCDIKPANILLDADGEWFLCDYGSGVDLSIARTGRSNFTVSYIPTDIPMIPSKKLDAILLAVTALFTVKPNSLSLSSRFNTINVLDSILALRDENLRALLQTLLNSYP